MVTRQPSKGNRGPVGLTWHKADFPEKPLFRDMLAFVLFCFELNTKRILSNIFFKASNIPYNPVR
jgi:hypothetical protein